jgi:hypothetical protein
VIKNYGLHWDIDKVFWGRQRNPGTLLGTASRSKLAHPVDFREQRGIYALYANYELVYIGQTGAGSDRLFQEIEDSQNRPSFGALEQIFLVRYTMGYKRAVFIV